jgi:hypothetical protein
MLTKGNRWRDQTTWEWVKTVTALVAFAVLFTAFVIAGLALNGIWVP